MKMWAKVENGKIVHGPMGLPENYFSKQQTNAEVSTKSVIEAGWLPVLDNSLEVDQTKFAVSADYKMEIFSDRIVKTHKIKEFPVEFIEAYNNLVKATKENESK